MMKYIPFIFLFFFSFNGVRTYSATKKQANVIVILTDDQGYGDMSCTGNPWIKTPEMDRLHDEGIRLTDFHVDPTCAPTRAALMTGRYSARTGVWLTFASRNHLRRDEVTMADIFKQNGYKTAIFGKWHLGENYPFRPQDRGFDESLVHGGGVVGEAPDYWNNNYYNDIYLRNGQREKVEGYCTNVWFNETMRFVEENKDNPFFIYLPTNTAHAPLHVPEKYRKPYNERGAFYGTLACIDENIGKLRKRLEELSLDENTIIVFFNDNGTGGGAGVSKVGHDGRDGWEVVGYNAGMRGKKSSHYEGGHRGACFMYWHNGGLAGGKDINGLTAHIDLLPTFVDLCALKYEEKLPFDGVSLAPVLQNENMSLPERSVIVHDQGRFTEPVGEGLLIKGKEYSVMNGKWRLVGKDWNQNKGIELYDVQQDPGQRNDVAEQHPDMVKRLQKDYEIWWDGISQNSNEYCPVAINPQKQRETKITSQSLMGGYVAYNQRHVRGAMKIDGYSHIDVETSGKYQITMRRWPKELDIAICDEAPMPKLHPSTHTVNNTTNTPCAVIKAVKARLKVGNFDKTVSVKQSDKEIIFEVYLLKGEHKLQTWFTQEKGETVAAYYTYIAPI